MSKFQQERENFYRNSTVIVDVGKKVLVALLDNELTNQNVTLSDFINKHQHDIHHMCFNRILCCLCVHGLLPSTVPSARVLCHDQLDVLFDKYAGKHPSHNTTTLSQYCCSTAKSAITASDLDVTLLRFLLINFVANCSVGQPVRKAIDQLVQFRNELYGHTKEAKISTIDFQKHQPKIEKCILEIADICNIKREIQQNLTDAYKRPLDEMICMQFQNLLLNELRRQQEIQEDIQHIESHATDLSNQIQCQITDSTKSIQDELGNCNSNIENKLDDIQKFYIGQDIDIKSGHQTTKKQIEEAKLEVGKSIKGVRVQLKDSEAEITKQIQDAKSCIQIQCKDITDNIKETNKQSIENIEYMKGLVTEHGSLQAQTQDRIRIHKRDTTLYKTHTMSKAAKRLKKHNALVILGMKGIGKSTTVMHLAKCFEEQNFVPIFFSDTEIIQHRHVLSSTHKYFIIVDDLFGKKYEEHTHTKCLDFLFSLVKGNQILKLVVTIVNAQIGQYDIMERHAFFENVEMINLDARGFSDKEKINILLNHMRHNSIAKCLSPCDDEVLFSWEDPPQCNECREEVLKLPDGQLQLCSDTVYLICVIDTYIGFPEMCRLFCSDPKNTLEGVSFFQRTTKTLANYLNGLFAAGVEDVRSRYQYCLLLYMAMSKLCLYYDTVENNFKDDSLFLELLAIFENVPPKLRKTLVKNALRELEGNFLIKTADFHVYHCDAEFQGVENTYILKDQSIQNAVLFSYGTECSEDFLRLEVCDIKFIMSYIRPLEDADLLMEDENIIFVPKILLNAKLYRILRSDTGMKYLLKNSTFSSIITSAKRSKNAEEQMTITDEYGIGIDRQSQIRKENLIYHKILGIACEENLKLCIGQCIYENVVGNKKTNKKDELVCKTKPDLSIQDDSHEPIDKTKTIIPKNNGSLEPVDKTETTIPQNNGSHEPVDKTETNMPKNDDSHEPVAKAKTFFPRNEDRNEPEYKMTTNLAMNDNRHELEDKIETNLAIKDDSHEAVDKNESNLVLKDDSRENEKRDSKTKTNLTLNEILDKMSLDDNYLEDSDDISTDDSADNTQCDEDNNDTSRTGDGKDNKQCDDIIAYKDKLVRDRGIFHRYIMCSNSERVGLYLRQCLAQGFTKDLVSEFFDDFNIFSITPPQLTDILNGLTRRGTCTQLLSVKSEKLRNIILHYGGIKLICLLFRPKCNIQNSQSFYQIESSILRDLIMNMVHSDAGHHILTIIGNYLYQILTFEGYSGFVDAILKDLFKDCVNGKDQYSHQASWGFDGLVDGLFDKGRNPSAVLLIQRFVPSLCWKDFNLNLIFCLCQEREEFILFAHEEHVYIKKTKPEFIQLMEKRMFFHFFSGVELKNKIDFSVQTKDLGNDLYKFGLKMKDLDFMEDLLLSIVNICTNMTSFTESANFIEKHFFTLLIKGFTNENTRLTELQDRFPKSLAQMQKHVQRYDVYMETGNDCATKEEKFIMFHCKTEYFSHMFCFPAEVEYVEEEL